MDAAWAEVIVSGLVGLHPVWAHYGRLMADADFLQ